ncbi:hypothetical protein GCM10023318_59880 [Nocardia callitridis]|uniref:Uncharacterized protein n=2 Tax=Nocardia callitridis TaxID=648753 RepID=A0ABP9L3J7_9NOCA
MEGGNEGVRIRMRFDQYRRRLLATRVILLLLALQGAFTGLWAVCAPHSWYTSFPGFAMRWVSVDGPYNHHLAADVGAFFLALTAVTVAALVVDTTTVARIAGLGWAVFSVPHVIYHVSHHPHDIGAVSFTLSLVAVLLLLAGGIAALVLPPRGDIPMSDPAPLRLRFPRRPRRGGTR